ncbi:MAG: OmpA family protein [Roseibium sp.]|uniref:OmpA family protein n=1 Tax=Roseibium sp. TaxID=1936156 RepID=UPI001B0845F2|nr:OmpA family protein [Roseibium sp.]MBO6894607.1 OmpA family protein [Roseibium sp.]MBO6928814.1 OmpA family protein [Roseibium sp.]
MTFDRSVFPACLLACLLLISTGSLADDSFFDDGWTLQPDASSLRFQSVKNLTVVESSGFVQFAGTIDETGTAKIRIFLDSVDTKIDLRNVRMRFLFFETFQFPEAVITAKIDPSVLQDLPALRRKSVPLTFTLDLHGVSKTFENDVVVTLMNDDLVAVSSGEPISVAASDFGFEGGIKKLEEAANVVIVPSATVTFDFMFSRNEDEDDEEEVASVPQAQEQTELPAVSAALEPEGNFDQEACKGRFEILSRTDNIYFGSGSSRLDARSEPLLDSLVDIISRCPGLVIEVGGHTDSYGSDAGNMRLSQRRANAVTQYLSDKNVPQERLVSVGYGETRPVAPNNTSEGRRRNRRIEFTVVE